LHGTPSLAAKALVGWTTLLDKVQKLTPCFAVALEAAQHAARNGAAVLLLDASHHHAKMIGFHHHADSLGFELLLKS
jgi:hypothetical protein